MKKNIWKSFELKIIATILTVILSLSMGFYLIVYNQYYKLTIDNLEEDARIIHQYVEEIISKDSFLELNTREDETKEVYLSTHRQLDEIRRIANILYLYTAKQNEYGEYIYVLDGLDPKAEDFRHVGDPIEEAIIPELRKCLNNETVLGDRILVTEWGTVYVTYFPVHDDDGSVIGAIGMEFDCENLYNSFSHVRLFTIVFSLILAAAFLIIAIFILKRVVRSTEAVLYKKDQLLIAAKEEAMESSKSKSDFLSRMSHEIRTPMNAIIGMTTIADNSDDISKIKYCLSTIRVSSAQLLSLINDILDMSKIEAGKFVLDCASMNIEKMLMKVCNLVIDKTEQKSQRFDVFLDSNMKLHYIADELRISQIITNLLSNAVKFTPENGAVTLSVKETQRTDKHSVLRFTVSDTGIGMTREQLSKLFKSFEQADGTISRKFGGTGLGLSISKSLVEKMGGKIWVESEYNKGSTFSFEIELERLQDESRAVIFDGISPADLKILFVDNDENIRQHFTNVMANFGITSDPAENGERAYDLVLAAKNTGRAYDVIFIDYQLPGQNGLETAKKILEITDKNTAIIMVSFLEWNRIEKQARNIGINRFISKPLFPSSILDAINEVIGNTIKKLEMTTSPDDNDDMPDFSNINLLLAEDIEINREIVLALLEETHINIDIAENGAEAVRKFKENPDKYTMIFMDIQMPEMDGYQATAAIRETGNLRARSIPIIAMTANAFKEDIDKCIEAGMNDHLAKPINLVDVVKKIRQYS